MEKKPIQIVFNTRDELTKVNLEEVVYIESDGNYIHIVFISGHQVLLLLNLANMEKLLDNVLKGKISPFLRIGKRYIVNMRYIFQINILKQALILTDCRSPKVFTLSISREALRALKELMSKSQTE